MAVGAQDRIDKLLVKKYAKEQVDNHELGISSMVDPEKMMSAMNDYAAVQRNMFAMSNKLAFLCSGINAKARYATR
jgi:hypothetical protein